jgi:hypothetical protein
MLRCATFAFNAIKNVAHLYLPVTGPFHKFAGFGAGMFAIF